MVNKQISQSLIKRCFSLGFAEKIDRKRFKRVPICCSNARQSFSIFIPTQYELSNPSPDCNSRFKELARFTSLDTGEVTVRVSELERDVSPLEWYCGDAEDRLTKILIRRDLRTFAGVETDVLVQYSNSLLGRVVVFKDGSNLFCVECKLPIDVLASDPSVPLTICHSFELRNPTKHAFAEPIEKHANHILAFDIPNSWILRQDEGGVTLNSVFSNGILTIDSDCTRKNSEEYAKECFAKRIEMAETKHFRVLPTESGPEFEQCVYGLAKFGAPQLAVVSTSFLHRNGRSCLMLVTPSFKSDSKAWAINKRAYEITRDSLRFKSLAKN